MKWMVYGTVIAAALIIPVERMDVGKLQPIEVVAMATQGEQIILKTELGDKGTGMTVQEALENMKQTTSGIVYLDTAEYLLVDEGAKKYIADMREYLKENVRMCMINPAIPLEEAPQYLDIHRPKLRLDEWNGQNLQEELVYVDGRFALKKKE